MALSKNYTGKIVGDIIRNIAEELGSSRLQPLDIIDYINLATQLVSVDVPIKEYETYSESIAVSSNSLNISTLSVVEIRKIVDLTNGKLIPVDSDEIENLTDNPRKQSNIYYYQEGKILRLYKGSKVSTYGTMRIVYLRELTLISDEDDYLDIPDRFVPAALEIAKKITYEKLQTATNKNVKEK